MVTETDFQDRIPGAGKAFVLVTSGVVPLADEAKAAHSALAHAVDSIGGYLIEDGVIGATPTGFADLVQRREAGAVWDQACPVPGGGARSRQFMKLPVNMMVYQGFPCWFAGGRSYTLDLFNAGNELGVLSEGGERAWAVVVWPHTQGGFSSIREKRPMVIVPPSPLSWKTVQPAPEDPLRRGGMGLFADFVGAVAAAINADFGLAGTGLTQLAYQSRAEPGSVGPLSDWVLPFMLLRRDRELPGVRLLTVDEEVEMTGREGWCRIIWESEKHRLVWAAMRQEQAGFPDGAPAAMAALARSLGRKSFLV